MIKNIVLDFGHGGIDETGACSTTSRTFVFPDGVVGCEGAINRRIGGLLEIFLQSLDLNVVTTIDHNNPTDLSRTERIAFANRYNPSETIFISIHCNASPGHNASGFEIFTYTNESLSDDIADIIWYSVYPLIHSKHGLNMRFDDSDGDMDKEARFDVLRYTRCPAVLIECLFYDYRPDFDFLIDPAFQKELAYAIFQGVETFLMI